MQIWCILHCLADIRYTLTTRRGPLPTIFTPAWTSTVILHDSISFLIMASMAISSLAITDSVFPIWSAEKTWNYFKIYRIPNTGILWTFWSDKCAESSLIQTLVLLPFTLMVLSLILKLLMGFRSIREWEKSPNKSSDQSHKEKRRRERKNQAPLGTESIFSVGHWPQDPWQTSELTDDQVLL